MGYSFDKAIAITNETGVNKIFSYQIHLIVESQVAEHI